jgi:hypothetical protein
MASASAEPAVVADAWLAAATEVMDGCDSEEEWDTMTDILRDANGGELPPCWPVLIGPGGLRETLRLNRWEGGAG